MTDFNTVDMYTDLDAREFCGKILSERVKEASSSLYATSKEKYNQKAKIIENAEDLSTEQKLEALDRNYDRHAQEVWQNVITFGVVSVVVIGVAAGSPVIVKNVRRLIA